MPQTDTNQDAVERLRQLVAAGLLEVRGCLRQYVGEIGVARSPRLVAARLDAMNPRG